MRVITPGMGEFPLALVFLIYDAAFWFRIPGQEAAAPHLARAALAPYVIPHGNTRRAVHEKSTDNNVAS